MFMTKCRIAAALVTVALLASGVSLLPAADKPAEPDGKLTLAEFDKLHGQLTKLAKEGVWAIPWQTSIREGRELAAKEKKPLAIWYVAGNPLGQC